MKKHSNPNETPPEAGLFIELRPRNSKELAALYNISAKTLKKWLAPFEDRIGKKTGNYYTIPQMRIIFCVLGFPGVFYEAEEGGGEKKGNF